MLTHQKIGDVLIVQLPMHRLDASTGETLREKIESLTEEEPKVVFDLHRVDFVDSAGLAALLAGLKHIVALGGDLKLCAPTPRVRDTLELARLPKIVEILPSRSEALDSYA